MPEPKGLPDIAARHGRRKGGARPPLQTLLGLYARISGVPGIAHEKIT